MTTSFALTVQRLPHTYQRVLVLGQLAGAQAGDGWFAPSDVTALFESLRLDRPGNISDQLARLQRSGWTTSRLPRPSWSLQPEGREAVTALVGDVDAAAVAAELVDVPGAELGHALHTVLPPSFAPVKWKDAIQRMLREFDFDTNVFCMTRFPADEHDADYLDPVKEIIPAAREVLRHHGLNLHLASDRQLDDDLYGNIAAHMWASRYGVGLFEDLAEPRRGLNENMIIEVGSMVITGRRCALLKDPSIPRMPTDFIGQIYKPVDFGQVQEVVDELHRWAADDLALGGCRECPPPPSDV